MISQELKKKAFELRRNGMSYGDIKKETGIALGMLSYWFSKLDWSKAIIENNRMTNISNSKNRILYMNEIRSAKLIEKYDLAKNEASRDYNEFKNDPLFIASLMLYAGEGDKSPKTSFIRMANIEYSILRIFVNFLVKYCDRNKKTIKFWLLAYPELNINECEKWWMEKIGLKYSNLYKTQVIQSRHKTKKLLYGVGNIIISNKVQKVKILKWIELLYNDLV